MAQNFTEQKSKCLGRSMKLTCRIFSNLFPFILVVNLLVMNCAFSQSTKGTITSLESILKEAGDLKVFLSSSSLRNKYFNELVFYMGDEPHFRASYDEILFQLEAVVEKYPDIIPRVWDELPIQVLNLKPIGQDASIHSKLRIRSVPRLFHTLFKGIVAHEPTGGHLPFIFDQGEPKKMSSLTPLRWASPLIEGAQFYHVEAVELPGQISNLESYKGFIQITPGEIKEETYGDLEISSMDLVLTDNEEVLSEKLSTMNRCIQEIYRRVPKNWKGLIVSNARLNTQYEDLNSLTEFRTRNLHYIFGESLKSSSQHFKINDSLVLKLAEFKYATNEKTGSLFVQSNQLIIQATVSQDVIDGVERFSPYLKDLTILNPEFPHLKESYSLAEMLALIKKASNSGREEGLLKLLLSRINETSEKERIHILNEYKNSKISPQTLMMIYSAKGINDLSLEEVKILMSLEGMYQQRYYNFNLLDAETILKTKRLNQIANLSLYLTDIYRDVYNLKLPIRNWLKNLEKVLNYQSLLLFQGLNQSFEVSLAAARALQLIHPIQTPPAADQFIADALEHGIQEFNGDQFLIVNMSYLEKLLADYIKSAKANSKRSLVTNIIKFGLSNLSYSDRIASASIEFLSQEELKLDQELKNLILTIHDQIVQSNAHQVVKNERIKKIKEILLIHSEDYLEKKSCHQLIAEIIRLK